MEVSDILKGISFTLLCVGVLCLAISALMKSYRLDEIDRRVQAIEIRLQDAKGD